jgi:hypothetical protein
MKKRLIGGAVAAAGVLTMAMPASAHEHGMPEHEVPEHGHVLLLHVDEAEFTYRKCIDLPSGRGNSWKAHHYGIHTGTAGRALARAGHAVVPTNELIGGAPFLPANCADVDRWVDLLKSAD